MATPRAIQLDASDFAHGSLKLVSYARPAKLFTAHASLVAGTVGTLQNAKFTIVRDAVMQMIQKG
jgi:mRNA interferase MazF